MTLDDIAAELRAAELAANFPLKIMDWAEQYADYLLDVARAAEVLAERCFDGCRYPNEVKALLRVYDVLLRREVTPRG